MRGAPGVVAIRHRERIATIETRVVAREIAIVATEFLEGDRVNRGGTPCAADGDGEERGAERADREEATKTT